MLDLSAFEIALDEDVLMVSVMLVNNEVGTIQDLPLISKLLSSRNIPLHCDAAQAPSAMDVKTLAHHADMISLSAHKMYGPQGIGALYIRRDLQDRIQPLIFGGGQQKGLRSGTLPLPLCVGMATAAEIATNSNALEERRRIARLRDTFIHLLQKSSCPLIINGPLGDCRHPGNANLRFEGFDAHALLGSLQPNLAASTGAACTTGFLEPSHVLRALGLSVDESAASIRFSFGRFTTEHEIDSAAALVRKAVANRFGALI